MTAPATTTPTRATPKVQQAPRTSYEYRICPDNPTIVQVRRVNHRRLGNGRGAGWRTYMEANSPQDAERILSMLAREEDERAQVTP